MPLRMRTPLPSLQGAALWINGEPDVEELRDRPLVVQFWSVSCYICHDVADRVNAWREKFGPQGVAFVSIHQPRSEAELDLERVTADALNEMKITQPCAIDNEHALVERFENQFVPAYYIFDRAHQLRHFQAGDKGYDRIESAIQRVLDEQPAAT